MGLSLARLSVFFCFQAEDGIRDWSVTGVQTCALPIWQRWVEQADNGGSSIAHLLLHVARHQDLAVSTAIRNHPPLFAAHRAALGLDDARQIGRASCRERV